MKDPKFNPLTFKQRLAADLALADPTLSKADIGAEIGLDARQVGKMLKEPQVKVYMATFLDQAGATLEKSARVISEGLDATEHKFFSFEGQVTDEREVVDHEVRLKAAEMNLKIRGEWREGAAVQFNQFLELSDEQLAAIANGQAKPQDFNPKGAQDA